MDLGTGNEVGIGFLYVCMYINKITFGYLPGFRTCRQFRFPDGSAPPNTQMLWGTQEGMKLACSYRGSRPSEVAESHWCVPGKHFTQVLDWGSQLLRLLGKLGGRVVRRRGSKAQVNNHQITFKGNVVKLHKVWGLSAESTNFLLWKLPPLSQPQG